MIDLQDIFNGAIFETKTNLQNENIRYADFSGVTGLIDVPCES